MSKPLQTEFDYYLANQDELVKKYNGRAIVIKGEEVIGDYVDQLTAVKETQKRHELGSFLVQKVEAGPGAYTQSFHSRVVFSSPNAFVE